MRHSFSYFFAAVFIAASFAPAAFAEDRAGFIAGTNLSKLSTDPDIGSATDSNILVGGFAEFELSEAFFIEPQLRYIEKGGDVSSQYSNGTADVSRTLKYVEIPLQFKWKFRAGERLRPYAYIGPSLAFKIGDATTITPRNNGNLVNLNLNNDSVRSFDFAAEAGGGLEMLFTDEFAVRLGAAYSLGLLDVNESPANWKTRGLQVYAGLSFAY